MDDKYLVLICRLDSVARKEHVLAWILRKINIVESLECIFDLRDMSQSVSIHPTCRVGSG